MTGKNDKSNVPSVLERNLNDIYKTDSHNCCQQFLARNNIFQLCVKILLLPNTEIHIKTIIFFLAIESTWKLSEQIREMSGPAKGVVKQTFHTVKPILSTDAVDCRRRVLALYKSWSRQTPYFGKRCAIFLLKPIYFH